MLEAFIIIDGSSVSSENHPEITVNISCSISFQFFCIQTGIKRIEG